MKSQSLITEKQSFDERVFVRKRDIESVIKRIDFILEKLKEDERKPNSNL